MPTEPFVGEIMIFGGNFAPRGWALCNGQLLSISQNVALFSLLGTTYGGNGQTTFALPNLQGRAPMHAGQGPGLFPRSLGETSGSASVALLAAEMPSHSHAITATTTPGDQVSPAGSAPATPGMARGSTAYSDAVANTQLAPQALSTVGGGQPHNNMPPFLTLNYVIALQGVFPPRG